MFADPNYPIKQQIPSRDHPLGNSAERMADHPMLTKGRLRPMRMTASNFETELFHEIMMADSFCCIRLSWNSQDLALVPVVFRYPYYVPCLIHTSQATNSRMCIGNILVLSHPVFILWLETSGKVLLYHNNMLHFAHHASIKVPHPVMQLPMPDQQSKLGCNTLPQRGVDRVMPKADHGWEGSKDGNFCGSYFELHGWVSSKVI